MKLKQHLIATASAALMASMGAYAAGNTATTTPAPSVAERPMAPTDANGDPEQLENRLRAVQSRADYAKVLESQGYRISAINQDKKDYLEYEVVKGNRSYEVQLDFKDGAQRATKVDVTNNMWQADATKRMLKDANYKNPTALSADPAGRYSDSRYRQAWSDEKDRLEKALPANLKVSEYKPKIESMGYKVTAVNDRDKDHVEYEIAKGDHSYEVKIAVDPQTQLAKDVDVTSNLWEAAPTDRATDRASTGKN